MIGRNQVPWVECDVAECERLGVPVLRRYSGGGTVFHDLGNSLYSIMTPRDEFSRSRFGPLICAAFARRGLALQVNERHDLLLGGLKVSGSAFRITRDRAYHHGTMLRRSDLGLLQRVLRSPHTGCLGVTVSSVPSAVGNLGVPHGVFVEAMLELLPGSSVHEVDEASAGAEVAADMRQLASWDWTFGKGPRFGLAIGGTQYTVENGLVGGATRFDTQFIASRTPAPG